MSSSHPCINCGHDTTNPKFCSRSCSASVTNRLTPKRKPEGRCFQCGAEISTKCVFCKECYDAGWRRRPQSRTPRRPSSKKTVNNNAYMASYMAERRLKRRKELIQLGGGSCIRCGSTETLEIDHIIAADKSFGLDSRGLDRSWEKILEEFAKCQILCYPCHRIKTKACGETGGGQNKILNPKHGTAVMYDKPNSCRCGECKAWKRQYRHKEVDAQGHTRVV